MSVMKPLRPSARWGSFQRSPDPITGFKGFTSKGREGTGREERGGEEKKEKGQEGEKGKGGGKRKREGLCSSKIP